MCPLWIYFSGFLTGISVLSFCNRRFSHSGGWYKSTVSVVCSCLYQHGHVLVQIQNTKSKKKSEGNREDDTFSGTGCTVFIRKVHVDFGNRCVCPEENRRKRCLKGVKGGD
jgi:hypothetical protein